MIDPKHRELSVRRQCELLRVSRSGLYYEPVPTDEEELALMRRIDELHLRLPFFGSRKIADALRKQGLLVNRKRVQRLMRLMGLEALAPKPKTSEPHPEHAVYPYLLKGSARGAGERARTGHPQEVTIVVPVHLCRIAYSVCALEGFTHAQRAAILLGVSNSTSRGARVRFPPPLVFLSALLAGIAMHHFVVPESVPLGRTLGLAAGGLVVVVGIAVWSCPGFLDS